jgi:peptidoglycan/xylan/chitin deacetylase (PgdA/CDA1 family)
MKYFRALALILFLALAFSCASRPISRQPEPPPLPVQETPLRELPPEKASGPFERAIQNVKDNTPVVKKYFQLGEDAEIIVQGECRIGGNDFSVNYDLAAAGREDGGAFRIPFLVEDTAGGVFSRDELFWTPAKDKTGLLLSFDDDYWPVWKGYFDLFDRFDAKATFFVQGGMKPSGAALMASPDDEPPPMTDNGLAAFCAEVLERGHDLGYHSVHHLDLTKVSREVFDRETIEAAAAFHEAGIAFSAFAYPFGFSQPWMQEALAPAFGLTRGYGVRFRLYDLEAVKEGYIISKAIDNIIYAEDDDFERSIHLMLLTAKFIDGDMVIPFTTHDISDKAQWGIKPGRLEYLLKTAGELKLRYYTYRDFR